MSQTTIISQTTITSQAPTKINPPQDPLRTWKLTRDQLFDEIENLSLTWIDSSQAWHHFELFFASHGYQLRFRYCPPGQSKASMLSRRQSHPPNVDFHHGLGDPFRPDPNNNLPFVFHDPTYFLSSYDPHAAPWHSTSPCLSIAYDKFNRLVAIKAIPIPDPSQELQILLHLNSPSLRSHPENHSIPILHHITSPNHPWQFVLMPAWLLSWDGAINAWHVDDYFLIATQLLEGLAFFHDHAIAHGDISLTNIVFNHDRTISCDPFTYAPLISRWDCRLAFIDFGASIKFDLDTDPSTWTSTSNWGTPPCLSPEKVQAAPSLPYKALPADVYAAGAALQDMLDIDLDRYHQKKQLAAGLGDPNRSFPIYAHQVLRSRVPQYQSVLQHMMATNPDHRPTAREALQLIHHIRDTLPSDIRFAPVDGYSQSILRDEYISPSSQALS